MKFLLLLPILGVCLTSCGIQRAMDCNKYAIQRSTCAIERNVEALEKVTHNLQQMHDES